MSELTALLDFFKYTAADGASTFNIELALNQNWDKITAFAARVADIDLSNVDKDALAGRVKAAVTAGALTAGDVGADQSGAAQTVQGNLTQHMTDKDNPHDVSRAQLEIGKTVWGTAAFPAAGWTLTEDGTAYTQTVSLASAKAAMRFTPDIRLLPSDDADAAALEKEAFALLSDYGETGDGTLTLTTAGTDAPQVAFTVMLLGEVA